MGQMEQIKVLHVGCGVYPLGDVNIDLYITPEERRNQGFVNVTFKKKPEYLIRADAHHLPFKSDVFDKVICHHTIEHLLQPYIALTEMYRTLKENGILVLDLPNSKLVSTEHPTHFYSWTSSSLSHLLEYVGFKVESIIEVIDSINMRLVNKK